MYIDKIPTYILYGTAKYKFYFKLAVDHSYASYKLAFLTNEK